MHVTFPSGDLRLEGDLLTATAGARGAVICHPHPQYGGDMDNPVVRAVTSALQQSGHATLRFNFRGTGRSTGAYGHGLGEVEDTLAAIRYLAERAAVEGITLAGYSFGAMVALEAGAGIAEVDRLIAVAPPLSFFDLSCVAHCEKKKLFVIGDRDEFCRVEQMERELISVAEPKALELLAGADHFLVGCESRVAEAVRRFSA